MGDLMERAASDRGLRRSAAWILESVRLYFGLKWLRACDFTFRGSAGILQSVVSHSSRRLRYGPSGSDSSSVACLTNSISRYPHLRGSQTRLRQPSPAARSSMPCGLACGYVLILTVEGFLVDKDPLVIDSPFVGRHPL